MPIKFKFKSGVIFETVDIDDQSCISVADLRAKIVRLKNLDSSQGIKLLFSNALTGHEYDDDDYKIPSGSSVIVKRDPAERVPSNMGDVHIGEKLGRKCSKLANIPRSVPLPVEMDLDDFGPDLFPICTTTIADPSHEFDKDKCLGDEKPNVVFPRLGTQKLNSCNISGRKIQMAVEPKGRDISLPNQRMTPALVDVDLPEEYICSICKTYFKEAVIIPCCGLNFCGKCIRAVLIHKGRCPNCDSNKFTVADLISNVLSSAIELLVESRMKALQKDASGPKEQKMPVSPTSEESVCNKNLGQRSMPEEGNQMFQGPMASYYGSPFWNDVPFSLMKSCSSNIYSNILTGNQMFQGPMASYYGSPFWNDVPFSPMKSCSSNIYSNYGMMHFNPVMVPASQYIVPQYMTSGVAGMRDTSRYAPQYQAYSQYYMPSSDTLVLGNPANRVGTANERVKRRSHDDEDDERFHTTYPKRRCG